MYERFTDRARKVMQLANEEASRLQHEYIGTEHILLGLLKMEAGGAALALKSLDYDLGTIQIEVEKIIQTAPTKGTYSKRLPHTPRAKKVVEYAIEEARGQNCSSVGTEHLLIGLLRVEEGVAAQAFRNLSLKVDEVRQKLFTLIGNRSEVGDSTSDPSTEEPRAVLKLANGEAQRLNHHYIGTEHLLLAIAFNEICMGARVLQGHGIGLCKLRDEVERIHPANSALATTWQLPHPPETRAAIERALEEARNLNHKKVRSEHYLLGLLRDENCVASQILTNLNIDLEGVLKEVLEVLDNKGEPPSE